MLEYIANLYKNSDWEYPAILAGDISGEIFFYPDKTLNFRQKLLGILTFILTAPHAVSCIDFILEHGRSVDKTSALLKWKTNLQKFSKNNGVCKIFVTDLSWALIKSILETFMKDTIQSYIEKKYEQFMCGNELKKGESVILIDILHLIKIFLKAAKKKAPKKVAEKFVIIFLKFLTWRTLVQAKELWLLMSKYFGLKTQVLIPTLKFKTFVKTLIN